MLDPQLPDLQTLIGSPGLQLLQQHGLLKPLIERMLVAALISDLPLDDEVRTAARRGYCQQHNLPSEEALQAKIAQSNLSDAEFDEQLLRPARMAQLAREQFGAKAEARFLVEKGRLDRVVYSLLRLESRSQALELYLRIAHGEANFSDLAGRYSQGSERNTNGVVGPAPLNQAHPVLSEKLRAAKPGSLLEPFQIERWWVVARLERFSPATFDDRMAEQMSMELFQEWVQQETARRLSALDCSDNGTAAS